MGCDIHCYIEYAHPGQQDEELYWNNFGGRINPGRDYDMFEIIAGVRGNMDQLFAPKGLPEGMLGWMTDFDAHMMINDELAMRGSENYVTLQQAESWGGVIRNSDDKPCKVSHPDWHNHSWLTYDELAQAIAHYILNKTEWPYSVEWDAILAVMRAFKERDISTRLVFWFDN